MGEETGTSGVVKGLIAGIGVLIIATIVVLMVISTIEDANLLRETETTLSRTDTSLTDGASINGTAYILAYFDSRNRDYTITEVLNETGETITSANYTFTASTGTIINSTAWWSNKVNISYTYIAESNYETTADAMGTNFTLGIDKVSSKLPTILLLAAVVLLFGVIVLLVRYSQAMGFGGAEGSL